MAFFLSLNLRRGIWGQMCNVLLILTFVDLAAADGDNSSTDTGFIIGAVFFALISLGVVICIVYMARWCVTEFIALPGTLCRKLCCLSGGQPLEARDNDAEKNADLGKDFSAAVWTVTELPKKGDQEQTQSEMSTGLGVGVHGDMAVLVSDDIRGSYIC